MQIEGQTALVTGANRGFERHLAQQLRDRGATVYAGARNPDSVDLAAGLPEVIADDGTKSVQAGLSGGVAALYPQFA
jgi:NAD(P)-dependent dehydrogenase (short-subunit alcohol dehydrogenase family)